MDLARLMFRDWRYNYSAQDTNRPKPHIPVLPTHTKNLIFARKNRGIDPTSGHLFLIIQYNSYRFMSARQISRNYMGVSYKANIYVHAYANTHSICRFVQLDATPYSMINA